MIGYVTVGTNDLARAAGFYDALLAELGAKRAMEMPTFIAWSAVANGSTRPTSDIGYSVNQAREKRR